ncbi:MAG TPA: hypothetical protein VJT72_03930 [Pseudonocardiaceae bacterium]|nr:hypothetical protein [Pseudonocardiaceae bacterium]
MDAFTGSGVAFRVEHFLHFVEEFGVDERFVPAGVFDAVIGDVAEVVSVTQHGAEAVEGDRSWAVAAVTFGA